MRKYDILCVDVIRRKVVIMKYCKNCGLNVSDETKYCPNCGNQLKSSTNTTTIKSYDEVNEILNRVDDHKSFGWGLIGFLFPIIGLILYLVWRDDRPLRAKSVGKGALTCVIIPIIIIVVVVIFGLIAG